MMLTLKRALNSPSAMVLSNQWGMLAHAQTEQIVGQSVAAGDFFGSFDALHVLRRNMVGQQAFSDGQHKDHPGHDEQNPDGCVIKELEGLCAAFAQHIADDQVGRCADQRCCAAEQGAERKRDQQFGRADARAGRQTDNGRKQNGDCPGIAHEGREKRYRQHDGHDQACGTGSGDLEDLVGRWRRPARFAARRRQ